MKSEEIKQLFVQFEAAASELEGIECWSARELQTLLGYSKWENFEKVIQKAKDACKNAGEETDYHFPDVRKMITKGKGAQDDIADIWAFPLRVGLSVPIFCSYLTKGFSLQSLTQN